MPRNRSQESWRFLSKCKDEGTRGGGLKVAQCNGLNPGHSLESLGGFLKLPGPEPYPRPLHKNLSGRNPGVILF